MGKRSSRGKTEQCKISVKKKLSILFVGGGVRVGHLDLFKRW